LYYLALKYLVMFFFLFVSLTVLQVELYILYCVPRHGAFAPRLGPFILENKKNTNSVIFQSWKLRILIKKIVPIFLKLNFTPNTLGCCGLSQHYFSIKFLEHIRGAFDSAKNHKRQSVTAK